MKKAELTLFAIAAIGYILTLFNIPAGSDLLLFSLFLLVSFYITLGIAIFNEIPLSKLFKADSYTNLSLLRISGTIINGICLSALVAGIFFYLLHYPGFFLLLLIGLILTTFISIIFCIYYRKSKSELCSCFLCRNTIFIIIGFIVYILY
ncbi:MAG: hypothetical protein WC679_04225 [Bacteroidales bacterium]|jgi:hypothetical protein